MQVRMYESIPAYSKDSCYSEVNVTKENLRSVLDSRFNGEVFVVSESGVDVELVSDYGDISKLSEKDGLKFIKDLSKFIDDVQKSFKNGILCISSDNKDNILVSLESKGKSTEMLRVDEGGNIEVGKKYKYLSQSFNLFLESLGSYNTVFSRIRVDINSVSISTLYNKLTPEGLLVYQCQNEVGSINYSDCIHKYAVSELNNILQCFPLVKDRLIGISQDEKAKSRLNSLIKTPITRLVYIASQDYGKYLEDSAIYAVQLNPVLTKILGYWREEIKTIFSPYYNIKIEIMIDNCKQYILDNIECFLEDLCGLNKIEYIGLMSDILDEFSKGKSQEDLCTCLQDVVRNSKRIVVSQYEYLNPEDIGKPRTSAVNNGSFDEYSYYRVCAIMGSYSVNFVRTCRNHVSGGLR